MLLCYNLCRSLLASQFLSGFIPCFLRRYLSSIFHCAGNVHGWVPIYCLQSLANDSARAIHVQGGGGDGSCRWRKQLCGCARKSFWRKIYYAQAEVGYWVPSRILILQGTGEPRSADHTRVQPSDRDFDCDPAVVPTTYV